LIGALRHAVAPKKENKGLPARWRVLHGAYYFRVPKGFESEWDGKQLFRLGKTLAEAYCMWADRIATIDDAKTIAELLDRHALGAVPLLGLKPRHVYKYIDKRAARSPRAAKSRSCLMRTRRLSIGLSRSPSVQGRSPPGRRNAAHAVCRGLGDRRVPVRRITPQGRKRTRDSGLHAGKSDRLENLKGRVAERRGFATPAWQPVPNLLIFKEFQ
jgi:hypothetical protein